MEFVFTTDYDKKAFKAMAKGLRKTVRKTKSKRSHIFGWFVFLLGLLLTIVTLLGDREIGINIVVTWIAMAVIVLALFFEDGMNAYIGRKQLMPGMEQARATFTEDGVVSETQVGTTSFSYNNITAIAEDEDYFIFLFHKNHAQAYDKNKMEGGNAQEFRAFIETATALPLVKV